MHILIIHQSFVSPQEPGGTRHYEFARHLVAKGHQVSIIASTINYLTGQRTQKGNDLVSEEILDGIRVLQVYTYPALHRSFISRVVSFFSFMSTSLWACLRVQNVDLVMGTSPPLFQAVSAWLTAAIRRRPFLLEIRDLWPEFAIDMGVLTNSTLIALSRWLECFLYTHASHLLVNSPAYLDYLRAKGISSEKISLIPNGVNPDMFVPDLSGKRFREEWRLDGKFVVTYTGALGLANDIPAILRTADMLKDDDSIHFLLVGDGKELASLKHISTRLELPNVTFAGSRPKSEMPEILAASDACVATLKDIPMFRTTYPNKVFDYMAARRPTILLIDGVIKEVVEAAGAGIFVPPGDSQAMAAAITYLADRADESRRMGLAAREYVVKHFNRNHQAEQFTELVKWLGAAKMKD